MKGIRNIIFDMGGVLLDLDKRRCIEEFRKIGYPQIEEMLGEYRQKGVFLELERGSVTPQEFYDVVRHDAEGEPTDEQIRDALDSFISGLPLYKLQMLLDLRKSYNVFMLSNTNAVMMPRLRDTWFAQQGLTLNDYFDKLFLSYEMDSAKPEKEIYQKMIAMSDMKPEESLFLDDGKANIDTARALGFNVYLAQPEEDFRHIFE